jgi:phospholipid/cholesterol/gamma-HCH transport system substrate-binding protein
VSTTAKSVAGALTLVLMLAVGYIGAQWALGAFDPDYRVNVVLGDLGQGVVSGSDVKIRGVLVGQVGEVTLTDDLQAQAELILEPDVRVPERATYAVTGKTLLGEKQVEIRFDGLVGEGPYLASGDTVSDPARVVELQDVLGELVELFEAIDPEDIAVLIDDGMGAFAGQGEQIARSVDQGARATEVFSRSLDDQVPALHDLSLVAETLGPTGAEFNRLGGEVNAGMPTITDNQLALRSLLTDLQRFSGVLNATLTLDRASIDRMIVEGDSVTRLMFAYRPEVGQLLTGLADYFEKFEAGGYTAPGVVGEAAFFQLMITAFDEAICHNLPPELTGSLPVCGGQPPVPLPDPVPGLPLPVLPGGDDIPELPLLQLPVPDGLLGSEVPERQGIESLFRSSLTGIPALPAPGEEGSR